MTMSKVTASLTVLIALCAVVPRAEAQREIHHVPPVIHPDGNNPDYLSPFVEPLAFNPDWQFFAPADFDTFGGGPDANTGWFATYDRLYLWVTRPEYVGSYTDGDFAWGNRWDIGYMTEEKHGWLFSFWHLDGPNNDNILTQERINVYNTNDEINGDPTNTNYLRGGGTTGGGGTTTTTTRLKSIPYRDMNNRLTKERDYMLRDSLNMADLSSWELNKTIRLAQRHYGSYVEPFLGIRYMKFRDYTAHDSYQRYDEDTGLPVPFEPPPLPDSLDAASIEQLTSLETQWANRMIGGQLGVRWYKLKGRWDLSGEVRAFAFQNFQDYTGLTLTETTYYAGTAADDEVTFVLYGRERVDAHASEFVWGGEVRAEAAFAVTQSISLRAGMSFLELAQGIARGNSPTRNEEDVTMVGWSFGATVNR